MADRSNVASSKFHFGEAVRQISFANRAGDAVPQPELADGTDERRYTDEVAVAARKRNMADARFRTISDAHYFETDTGLGRTLVATQRN